MSFSGLSLRLLGPSSAARAGVPVILPRSRKVRALLSARAHASPSRLSITPEPERLLQPEAHAERPR